MIQKLPLIAAAGLFLILANMGCRPSCDSIPGQTLASVRIMNAVSNSPLLLVYIDGRLFDSCWYDIDTKYKRDWNPKHIFGYRDSYISDGSTINAGQHHVAAMDPDTRDTVATWNGVLRDVRQSLIFVGRVNGSEAQTPRALYLNDVVREAAGPSFARFIDAVPDINGTDPGGLDVYFSKSPTIVNGVARPDLRIHFGHISDQFGGDSGTGLSTGDYLQFPPSVSGLLIMPIGDTLLNDAILNVPYSLPTSGILGTIVVRGETHPLDLDPVASVDVLEDGSTGPGSVSFGVPSFLIRLVNASRYPNLSLLIKGPSDTTPRAGIPAGAGKSVLDLGTDSVGAYIPLNPGFDGLSNYWFSKTDNPIDTVFHFFYIESTDERSTFIAIDTKPHNTGTPVVDTMVLVDTVSNPVDSDPSDTTHGRVRFVNTSPDYTAHFTFAGKPFSMPQRDVEIIDAPIGTYSISVTDGAISGTLNFIVTDVRPTTIFFMPSNNANPVPYRISTE